MTYNVFTFYVLHPGKEITEKEETMKTDVMLTCTETLQIKEVPHPQVRPNDILVKNIAVGICRHSDVDLSTLIFSKLF